MLTPVIMQIGRRLPDVILLEVDDDDDDVIGGKGDFNTSVAGLELVKGDLNTRVAFDYEIHLSLGNGASGWFGNAAARSKPEVGGSRNNFFRNPVVAGDTLYHTVLASIGESSNTLQVIVQNVQDAPFPTRVILDDKKWSQLMEMQIGARNKSEFITGKTLRPQD
ncbi:hypothetical protein Tco_0865604 [Tanacetum coccineum]